MKRTNPFDIHRWFAVPFAVALIAWLVSGVLMILPRPTPNALRPYEPRSVDWTETTVSPAQAAAVVHGLSDSTAIGSVELARIGGTPIYRIETGSGAHMIDATTGDRIRVTPELAVELARRQTHPDIEVVAVEEVSSHSRIYPYGPLPAYRIRFATDDASWAYVAIETGAVQFSSRAIRVRTAITAFHDFSALRIVFGGGVPTRGLMLLASGGMIVVIISGYYLALRKLRRARSPA